MTTPVHALQEADALRIAAEVARARGWHDLANELTKRADEILQAHARAEWARSEIAP